MSKYTTEVRYICEQYSGYKESVGYNDVDSVIESARGKLFDFKYPIFDEDYKCVLETKIIKHFYTREICAETVGLWKLWLNRKMNEIMPYYNKLYKSELLEFNPFYDVDLTREHNSKSKGTKEDIGVLTGKVDGTKNTVGSSNGNTNTSGTTKTNGTTENTENGSNTNTHNDYYSDTPQGGVSGLESLTYLSNARKVTDSGNNSTSNKGTNSNNEEQSGKISTENEYSDDVTSVTNTSTKNTNNSVINNTEDYLEHVSGKQGNTSYSKLLTEYRDTFLNIDMMVINELNDLFINLW